MGAVISAPTASDPTAPGRRSRRHYAWAAATVVLITAGIVAAVLAAQVMVRIEGDQTRQDFEDASEQVASTVERAIQHENDLVVDAGGLLADPALSQTSFLRWATVSRVLERYPEMTGLAVLKVVADADLSAFAARAAADPSGPLSAGGTFEVVPEGSRPFYCLVAAAVAADTRTTPAGADFCADSEGTPVMLAARDSGHGAYLAHTQDGVTGLVIQTPMYADGVIPDTVAGRREAFVGLVAAQLDPTALLDRVLRGNPDLSVELQYEQGGTDLTFTSGPAPAGAESVTIRLGDGWTVRTFGIVEPGSITHRLALVRLLGGITLSLLFGSLVFVVGTGRERARRQLEQRTRQLHHQALHDPLTGLPNRALVKDRIEQMLTRDHRHSTVGALLFLDLDNFKKVNDTLGHGVGDQLLIAVTARLSSTLRDADTLGRMGGDEFVILLDGSTPDVDAEHVAQRLLNAMDQPFVLEGLETPLTVSISIGVAAGLGDSADDLLRDADVALYQAKAAGKRCYAVFDPATFEAQFLDPVAHMETPRSASPAGDARDRSRP